MKKKFIMTSLITAMLIFAGCSGDEAEESGATASVSLTSLPYTKSDSININTENTENTYIVGLESGVYAISAKLLSGTVDDGNNFIISVSNSNDEVLATLNQNSLDATGEAEDLSFTATAKGNYSIKITRNNNADASYSLNLYPSIANGLTQNSNNEYNNFKEMATPLTLTEANTGISGDLNLQTEDKRDWYSIDLNKTGVYALSTEILSGTTNDGNNLVITVYNPSDEQITQLHQNSLDASGEAEQFTFNANVTGKYKIKYYRNNDTDILYTFKVFPSVENGLVQDTSYEYNDFKEMATPLTLAQMNLDITSNINLTNKDKSDWYSVELETGTYDINTELLAGTVNDGANMIITVLNTQNEQIAQLHQNSLDAEADTETLSFNANLAGTYKVEFKRSENTTIYYKYNLNKQ